MRVEREPQAPRVVLAREKFLDQERRPGEPLAPPRRDPSPGTRRATTAGTRARARRSRRRARRAARARRRRGAPRASPRRRGRRRDRCGRSTAAAPAPRSVGSAPGDVHAIAGGPQHPDRRMRVLRLEVIRERVDEEHDVDALAGVSRREPSRRNVSLRHAGSVRCAEIRAAIRRARRARQRIAQIEEPRHARRPRRPARQVGDQPIA